MVVGGNDVRINCSRHRISDIHENIGERSY